MSKIICIDPGHGGKDPGGGSNKHFKEKDMVLDISFEQKKHFERNGIKVVMTRTTDEYLDSTPRTNRVKNSGAKYCISNHINAFNGKAEGAETIHSIYADKKIAQGVLDAIVRLGARYRRVFSKQGNNGDWYYMLRMTGSVETIIIEYGFADNATDTKKIIKDWKAYAEAVARYYIEQVFSQKYIGAGKDNKPTDKPKPEPSKPKKKTVSQMAKEVIAGRHGNGVENRRKSLGISKAEMSKVQKEVNKQLGGSSSKPKGKSINKMAKEVIDGKHGNGHANRQKSLGISKSDYDKVRAEVNKLASGSKQSAKPKSLKVGQKVKIKSSAKKYTRTSKPVAIPAKYKNKSLTIQQVGNDDVLIKELVSWVKKTDVQ